MQLALVIGICERDHEASVPHRADVCAAPASADGRTPDGEPLLAVDGVGAGCGEKVIITSDGARGPRDAR